MAGKIDGKGFEYRFLIRCRREANPPKKNTRCVIRLYTKDGEKVYETYGSSWRIAFDRLGGALFQNIPSNGGRERQIAWEW